MALCAQLMIIIYVQVPCEQVVKTSLQTLLRRKATGAKVTVTELEPVTYTLSWSFSLELSLSVANPRLPLLYIPVIGVPLYSDLFKTYTLRLVQCVIVMESVGNSV